MSGPALALGLAASVALALFAGESPSQPPQDGQLAEPPLELEVRLGETSHSLALGATKSITVAGKAVELSVVAKPWRTLAVAGLSFRYPSNMSFEATQVDPKTRQWTLDGNDTVLILSHFAEGDADALRQSMHRATTRKFAKNKPVQSESKLTLGGTEYLASRLTVTVGESTIQQDFIGIPVGKGAVVMLVQDSVNADGSTSTETRDALKMIADSFRRP